MPGLTATIIGEGPLRGELQQRIDAAGASDWIHIRGRIDRHELVDEYRRAWLVVSGSLAEGWGLSLTEGAACGTPAVATDIRGHRSSVVAGVTGLLVDPALLGTTIADVLTDDHRRQAHDGSRAGTSPHPDVGRLGARHHQLPARRGRAVALTGFGVGRKRSSVAASCVP